MTQSIETSPRTVLISGHFDPFHYVHLDYIKQAAQMGDLLICIVTSDEQTIMKKGKVNEPEEERAEIIHLILKGLGIRYSVYRNHWDRGTTLVAKALDVFRPNIFCRGSDKTPKDIPIAEALVCDGLGIQVVYTKGRTTHGSEFV